jgi:ATP-dependent DNA ligase
MPRDATRAAIGASYPVPDVAARVTPRHVSLSARHVTARLPEWVEPMAATLTHERFAGPEWSFERKLDGIRLLAFKRGAEVRLLSRNRLSQNAWCPDLVGAIARLPVENAILDGEATGYWRGERGEATYHVFDVLWLDDRDVRALPLEARRALLDGLPIAPPLARVEALADERPWERALRDGWEGVIAKRRGSIYESRRSPHWVKMKCEASQELVVGGFTDPQGKRVGLGALLVGHYDGDDLVFAGRVGTGFDTALLLDLRARLDPLEISKPPFTRAVGLPRLGAHWVRPEIVVQVAFIEWTVHGKLRHPRLLGVRGDRSAREVRRETR